MLLTRVSGDYSLNQCGQAHFEGLRVSQRCLHGAKALDVPFRARLHTHWIELSLGRCGITLARDED